MRNRGSNRRNPGHERLQKIKSTGRLRYTGIVPRHITTSPSQILGYLIRRTAQNVKSVGKPDPETVECFPCTKFRLGEIHTQTIINSRTKKWSLPNTLPPIRSPEKVSPRQGDPQSLAGTNIIAQPTEQGKPLGPEKGRGQTHGGTPCELFS